MRICSPQLGLAPKSILGGEVFDRKILLGLAKNGIKAEIILPKDKLHDSKVKNWNITYLPISHFPAAFANILITPFLFNIFTQRRFEIIRIHQPQFLGLGCLFFKIFNREVKLVATYHQFRESSFGVFSKLINHLWDHIICDSENVRRKLIKTFQIPPQKITVVHNGVPSYLRPAEKSESLIKKFKLQGKIVILFMGLFDNRKNPLFLLQVLKNLNTTRSDLVVIFWGSGPLEHQIKARARELGIEDKIRIQKPAFGKDKNKIHNLADIFVHPSTDEGFALSPLESMACAKPIIMTNRYSAQEAVDDGINGFLCESNDVKQWSEKINLLAKSSTHRKKMGKASLSKVKKEFQWDLAVKKHIKVFKNLINEAN